MTTEHTDDYIHPRADLISELLRLEARISDARKLALAQHNAAQDDRVAMAMAGVGSSRTIDSRASGVALDMYVALS
jgi:hypothetical protein